MSFFTLGFDPNTPSRLDTTKPARTMECCALHMGVKYRFERYQSSNGLTADRLAIYVWDEYPAAMLAEMERGFYIRRVDRNWMARHGYGDSDVRRALVD